MRRHNNGYGASSHAVVVRARQPKCPWCGRRGVLSHVGGCRVARARRRRSPPNSSKAAFGRSSRPTASTAIPTDKMGGLRLDSREAMLKGGESGPAIVPGEPDDSLLIQAVRQVAGAPKMPHGRPKLQPEDIDALAEWVRAGAPWPATTQPRRAPAPTATRRSITPEQRAFWSFQPLAKTPPRRPCATPRGRRPTSIASCWRASRTRASRRSRAADKLHADPPRDARPDRAAADARRGRRVPEGRRRPTRSRRSSIACSRRRSTARRGAACGSTSRATAKTTTAASTRRAAATTRTRTRTSIATG